MEIVNGLKSTWLNSNCLSLSCSKSVCLGRGFNSRSFALRLAVFWVVIDGLLHFNWRSFAKRGNITRKTTDNQRQERRYMASVRIKFRPSTVEGKEWYTVFPDYTQVFCWLHRFGIHQATGLFYTLQLHTLDVWLTWLFYKYEAVIFCKMLNINTLVYELFVFSQTMHVLVKHQG